MLDITHLNVLLKAYRRCKQADAAVALLQKIIDGQYRAYHGDEDGLDRANIQQVIIRPDLISFNTVLAAMAEWKSYTLNDMHALLAQIDHMNDGNSIQYQGKNKHHEPPRRVVRRMAPDAFTYMTLLHKYLHEDVHGGILLFETTVLLDHHGNHELSHMVVDLPLFQMYIRLWHKKVGNECHDHECSPPSSTSPVHLNRVDHYHLYGYPHHHQRHAEDTNTSQSQASPVSNSVTKAASNLTIPHSHIDPLSDPNLGPSIENVVQLVLDTKYRHILHDAAFFDQVLLLLQRLQSKTNTTSGAYSTYAHRILRHMDQEQLYSPRAYAIVMAIFNRDGRHAHVRPLFETIRARRQQIPLTVDMYVEVLVALEAQEQWVDVTTLFLEMKQVHGSIAPALLSKSALGKYSLRSHSHSSIPPQGN